MERSIETGQRVLRVLVFATVALFAVRVLMSLARSGPVLFADEAGYLGSARMLSGGLDFVMGASPFYRAGYSVLLSPIVGLVGDPSTAYRLVLVLNAALAASLVPLLYILLRRCFDVAAPTALGGAIAGAAYPTVTSITQVALSENALFPLTVAWLIAVGMLLSSSGRRAVWWGLATGACAAALWIVHGRMIVVVGLTAIIIVALLARRRIPVGAGVAGLAGLAAGLVAGSLLNDLVVDRNYDGRRVDEVGSTLGALDDPDAILGVLRNLVGETWYLLVATFGILGLLLVVRGRAALAELRNRDHGVAGASLVLLFLTTAGLIAVTAVWFAEPTRPDQIVYGRYIEPTIPPLLALGVVTLAGGWPRPARRIVLGAIALLTVVIAAAASGLEFPGADANRWSVASLPFITGDLGPKELAGAGVVAVLSAWALAEIARRGLPVWLAVVALFVPITAFTEVRLILNGEDAVYPAGWTSPEPVVEAHGDRVAYDTSDIDFTGVKVYQWFLPDTGFELFEADDVAPPQRLFFSTPSWTQRHPELPADLLWRDPGRPQALWQLRASG